MRTDSMEQFLTDMRRDLEDRLQDYDFMKGQLMAQIISAKDNAERLEQMPHRQMKLRGCKDCRYFLRSLKQCSRGMENCILFSKDMAAGRPSCEQCYWWDEKRGCCRRGRAGCAYDLSVQDRPAMCRLLHPADPARLEARPVGGEESG